MKANIITIGDEILIGQITDTNSAWLGQRLNAMGIQVQRIVSVSDNEQEIADAVTESLEKMPITLVTGGLGPTKDDITKQTFCRVFGTTLVRHEATFQQVKSMMESRGIDFNELNQAQAMVPANCTVIPNAHGTAPGMLFRKNGNLLISMPGVPFEMKEMCTAAVFRLLAAEFPLQHNIHRTIITFGLPESMLAKKIEAWENALPPYLHLAYLPNPNKVRLRLSAYSAENTDACQREIEKQFAALRKLIPENFIGDETQELEVALAKLLTDRKETLSVAESCSGGSIAAKFTRNAGASAYFLAGVVSYSNEAKISLLGVQPQTIERYGAVSKECVEEMAQGARKVTGSTYSIATSGIAGPEGGSAEKPVGTVWIAVDTPKGTFSECYLFTKLREPNIERTASTAIYKLLQIILSEK